MMVKFGKYWGHMIADPLHIRSISNEFHEALTPEEKEAWRAEMKDVSMWSIFKGYLDKKKEEKAKAKQAARQAKKEGKDLADTDYFQGVLNDLREHGVTEEVAADGDE